MMYWILFFILSACRVSGEIVPFFQDFQPKHYLSIPYDIQNLSDAYYKNHYENVTPSKKPRIPKIIHHIWLGSPLPPKYIKYIKSWKRHHPDWTVKLWLEKDVFSFPFITGHKINQAKNQGQRSDIFRYEILYRYGGLYVDTDFLCLKPHDILHHTCDFYTSMSEGTIFNGLLGVAAKHPIIEQCLHSINQTSHFSTDTRDVLHQTGPHLFTQKILHHLETCGDEGIISYHPAYFYSFPAVKRLHFWKSNEDFSLVKPHLYHDAFAVHLWATSWNPKQYFENLHHIINNPHHAITYPKEYREILKNNRTH